MTTGHCTAGHFLYELLLTVGTWKYILCVFVFEQSPVPALLISGEHIPACARAPAPRDAASPRIHVKNNSIVFQLGPALFWRRGDIVLDRGRREGGGRPWSGFLLARIRSSNRDIFVIVLLLFPPAHTQHTLHLGPEISSFT